MSKKKLNKLDLSNLSEGGLVYSTNPNALPPDDFEEAYHLADQQKVYVELKRLKGNKLATVVTGLVCREDQLKTLGKELKMMCGTGGSAGNDEILVQGDNVKRVMEHLALLGYQVKRKGG